MSVVLKPTWGNNKIDIKDRPLTLTINGLIFFISIVHKTGKLLST